MDREEMLNQTSMSLSSCKLFSGVATRENWKRSFIENKDKNKKKRFRCPSDQRSAIRTHELQIKHAVFNQTKSEWKWLTEEYPIYFMIAKSGSTSILSYLQRYHDEYGYNEYGDIVHKIAVSENINVVQSRCSFTFVRDPMTRFISGYYTLNGLLWLSLKERFSNIDNDTFLQFELPWNQRRRHKFVSFASIKGEPQRVERFVQEMTANPYWFTRLWQFDHVQSQSEILSVYFGRLESAMHFVGKQERMKDHWTELTRICSAFFRNNSEIVLNDEKKKVQGFGWKDPWSWHRDYDRFRDFIEFMGLEPIYAYFVENVDEDGNVDMDAILPPLWYHIDEALYNDIVEYYFQDYQCFGYVPNYHAFVRKREQYINIYDI